MSVSPQCRTLDAEQGQIGDHGFIGAMHICDRVNLLFFSLVLPQRIGKLEYAVNSEKKKRRQATKERREEAKAREELEKRVDQV